MTWAAANHIARVAMGTRREAGRYGKTVWFADDDPLACWCLTELIMTHSCEPKSSRARRAPPLP